MHVGVPVLAWTPVCTARLFAQPTNRAASGRVGALVSRHMVTAAHGFSSSRFSATLYKRQGTRPACNQATAASHSAATSATPDVVLRFTGLFTNLFPVWIATGACVGLTAPSLVTWFSGNLITGALAFTMLGMGLTIDETDFTSVLRSPKQLVAGVALQYSVMPLLAFALSRVLPTPLAVGLILVGCCPGGTASNLVTYIASANVALSVVLTALSTALATVVTPALTAGLAGTLVPVPASSLMYSTGQVVLLPVCLGLALRRMFRTQVDHLLHWCPPIAVATVALICASVIGNNATFVRAAGLTLVASVVALHAGGFSLGYVCSTLLGFSERERRTISIEVGMQNSALGVVLALAHFGPASAVPAAISASTHSILGSMFAAIWRWSDARRSSSLSSELPIGGTVYI